MKNFLLKYKFTIIFLMLVCGGIAVWKLKALAEAGITKQNREDLQETIHRVDQFACEIKQLVKRFFSKNDTRSYQSYMSDFQNELNKMDRELMRPINDYIKKLEQVSEKTGLKKDKKLRAIYEQIQTIIKKIHGTMSMLYTTLKDGGNKFSVGLRLKAKKDQINNSMKDVSRMVLSLIDKLKSEDMILVEKVQCLKNELDTLLNTETSATEMLDILGFRLGCKD